MTCQTEDTKRALQILLWENKRLNAKTTKGATEETCESWKMPSVSAAFSLISQDGNGN